MKRYLKFFIVLIITAFIVLSVHESAFAKDVVTIVVDPGHGGDASVETNLGACYNGLVESDVNLQTALLLKSELEQYGNVKVFMTRSSNVEVSLEDRVLFAKSVGADFIVSVHHNASASHLLYGSEIFVPSAKQYASGYSLASCIMKQWVGNGAIDKGIKTRIGNRGDYYGLIRHGATHGIPTIILEHGYLDNYHDVTSFDDKSDWARTAKMDAAGIADFYGLKKGKKVKSITQKLTAKNPVNFVPEDTTGPILAMTINSYNKSTGDVRFSLTAIEPESRPYLFGLSTSTTLDENGLVIPNCSDLALWGNKSSVTGSFKVPAGYIGPLNAICYNNYNLTSNTVTALIGY